MVLAWVFALLLVVSTLLWYIVGKEIVIIDRGILTIKKSGALFSRTKSYAISDAKKFRVVPNDVGIWGRKNKLPYSEPGTIVFDYGMDSKNFGIGISEPEATFLINLLKEKDLIP
jgi:hypothetical protein